MLLARKGDVATVHGVPADHVYDLVVLIRGRSESPPTSRDVVEKVFNHDLRARSPRDGFGFRRLPRLGRRQLSLIKVSTPCTVGVFCFGGDGEMRNVAYASKGLASEAICGYRGQVLKFL